MKATSEQIVAAYKETGSVWKAAQKLGMAGQSVHERLQALGYKLKSQKWSSGELAELRRLAGNCTVSEIGRRLGRPYAGVALKISRLKLGSRYGNRLKRKAAKVAYDKARVAALIQALSRYQGSLRQFSTEHGLDIESLVVAIQRDNLEFWRQYCRRHTDLKESTCPYCESPFFPLTGKQVYCSRKCAGQSRKDKAYFGGKRRSAIGLAEGVCQLCMQPKESGLSAHHMLGKENDPENDSLIALCPGCHQIVGSLAGRKFVDTEDGWQNLIVLVMFRRLADKNKNDKRSYVGVEASVDLDWLNLEDINVEDEEETTE